MRVKTEATAICASTSFRHHEQNGIPHWVCFLKTAVNPPKDCPANRVNAIRGPEGVEGVGHCRLAEIASAGRGRTDGAEGTTSRVKRWRDGVGFGKLAEARFAGTFSAMTATLTLDDDGRLFLPESVRHLFGLQPGAVLQAEVTAECIELRREEKNDDVPEITELERTSDGTLVVPAGSFGKVDVVAAIKNGS